ncbi:hypothetical protein HK104_005890, partial [Borealophlyctis nickersoniae]
MTSISIGQPHYVSNAQQPAHDSNLTTMTPASRNDNNNNRDAIENRPSTDTGRAQPQTTGTTGLTAGLTKPAGNPTRGSHATIFGGHDGSDYGGAHMTSTPGIGHNNYIPTQVVSLRPIASPQALGLAAYASASFVFAAYLAEWYGNPGTGPQFWPFILTFGGLGQFAAGMWSFRSRDTLSTVIHTMWGSFWLSLGLFYIFVGISAIPQMERWDHIEPWAIWQAPLLAFTWAACIASLFRDWTLMTILGLMSTGSTLTLIGWFAPSKAVVKIGAYVWLLSSLLSLLRVFVHLRDEEARRAGFEAERSSLPLYRKGVRNGRREWGVGD